MASRLNYKGDIALTILLLANPLPIDGRPKIGRLKELYGEIIKGLYCCDALWCY